MFDDTPKRPYYYHRVTTKDGFTYDRSLMCYDSRSAAIRNARDEIRQQGGTIQVMRVNLSGGENVVETMGEDDVTDQLVGAVETLAEDVDNIKDLTPPESYATGLQQALDHEEEAVILLERLIDIPVPDDPILDVIVRTATSAFTKGKGRPFKVDEMKEMMRSAMTLYALIKSQEGNDR